MKKILSGMLFLTLLTTPLMAEEVGDALKLIPKDAKLLVEVDMQKTMNADAFKKLMEIGTAMQGMMGGSKPEAKPEDFIEKAAKENLGVSKADITKMLFCGIEEKDGTLSMVNVILVKGLDPAKVLALSIHAKAEKLDYKGKSYYKDIENGKLNFVYLDAGMLIDADSEIALKLTLDTMAGADNVFKNKELMNLFAKVRGKSISGAFLVAKSMTANPDFKDLESGTFSLEAGDGILVVSETNLGNEESALKMVESTKKTLAGLAIPLATLPEMKKCLENIKISAKETVVAGEVNITKESIAELGKNPGAIMGVVMQIVMQQQQVTPQPGVPVDAKNDPALPPPPTVPGPAPTKSAPQ